ncbi:Alpha/Beta hydrolase protein [Globomyces pollinis-pini]|nr:Alpha/Beta hydrolase protein [Globomyces pollinis-pini]
MIEGMFLTSVHYHFKNIQEPTLPIIEGSTYQKLKNEFVKYGLGRHHHLWLNGWFRNTHLKNITNQDVQEMMAGVLFFKNLDELNVPELNQLEEFIGLIKKDLPLKLQDRAHNEHPIARCCPPRDPIHIIHRPLAFYLLLNSSQFAGQTYFYARGFQRYKGDGLRLYFRNGSSKKPALVFFHGLGVGLTTYLVLIHNMILKYPNRKIFLFEMPFVSMRLDTNYVLPQVFADQVAEYLAMYNVQQAILIGHSFGTACIRWMDLFHPELIRGRIFIDPMCFGLFTASTIYNALYRKPKRFHEVLIKYGAMSEPGIATYFHRHFIWFQNTYFTDDLPTQSILYLSEDDAIVDVKGLLKYLRKNTHPSRKVVTVKDFFHGEILMSPEMLQLLNSIEQL